MAEDCEWFRAEFPQGAWVNVYPETVDGVYGGHPGAFSEDRDTCDETLIAGPAFRIHVRLKPEGAPRRYASEEHRRKWEAHSGIMQMHDPLFSLANLSRSPKTEESAS